MLSPIKTDYSKSLIYTNTTLISLNTNINQQSIYIQYQNW